MEARYTIGIDLGITSQHVAVVFDREAGKAVVKGFKFHHTADGFKQLVERVEKVKAKHGPGAAQAVMEPTGKVWTPVAGFLREHDIRTLMPSPMLATAYRKKRSGSGKSNGIDADALARLPQAEGDRLNPACLRDQKTGDLHGLCKFHEKLSGRLAGIKNSIRAEFQLVSPMMLSCFGEGAFTEMGRTFMSRYANPHSLLSRGEKRLIEMLAKHSSKEEDEVKEIVRDLRACAKSAVEMYRPIAEGHGLSFSFELVQRKVCFLLKQLALYEAQLTELEEEIATLHDEIDPDAASRSLPGFGKHISPVVDSAVADICRFARAQSFAGYVRTAPRQSSTGKGRAAEGEHERQPLRKDGNRYLQKQFYLAADVARRYDVELAEVYLKLKAKGRHHNQCVIAVARHLALRYYSLKKRVLEDPDARYAFRDLNGREISKQQAREIVGRMYEEAKQDKSTAKKTPTTPANVPDPCHPTTLSTDHPERLGNIIAQLAVTMGITPQALSGHLDQLQPGAANCRTNGRAQRSQKKRGKTLATT